MTRGGYGDAVRRYKELAERNTESVRRMREHDRALTPGLAERLAGVERALAEATERERVARMSVRLHWESAVEALWNERWLAVGPPPEPVPPPPGLTALAADAEVERWYDALREALRRAALLPRRQRDDS